MLSAQVIRSLSHRLHSSQVYRTTLAAGLSTLETPQQRQEFEKTFSHGVELMQTRPDFRAAFAKFAQDIFNETSFFLSKAPKGFEHFEQEKEKEPSSSSGSGGNGGKDNDQNNKDNSQKDDNNSDKSDNENNKQNNDKKDDKKDEKKDQKLESKSANEQKSDAGKAKESKEKKKKDFPWPKMNPDGDSSEQNDFPRILALVAMAFSFLGMFYFLYQGVNTHPRPISFQEFLTRYLEPGQVERLIVNQRSTVTVLLKDGKPAVSFEIGSIDQFERRLEEVQADLGIDPHDFVPIEYQNKPTFGQFLLSNSISIILVTLIGISIFMGAKRLGSNSGPFSMNKIVSANTGKLTENIKFTNVAGLDEAKKEIMEFVEFLQQPDRFTKLGAKIPKGALLVGPPGTGKTLLAKAVAGEAGCPFFSISGSEFLELYVGVGPARVRDLFKKARKNSPSIVFIDEIDAIGKTRGKGFRSGANDERENTLNQLLVEMDGFSASSGVIVLAGTNRADVLDNALLRPGRFDRQIYVGLPDIKGRREIFEVHLQKIKLAIPATEVANHMAALTPGMSGADIANVCNEAAIIAARGAKEAVELVDFENAVDRVIGGVQRKSSVMSPEEKKLVAFHEAGHAIVGWYLEHADPLVKVSIVPRAQSLGHAQYLPKEVRLFNKAQLLDKMCMALGGRAAEQVFFEEVSTGASDDLRRVTEMAYAQVQIYGLNDRIGNVSYPDDGEAFHRPFSESTATTIDEEVRKMVDSAYQRTIGVVTQYKKEINMVADKLLELETINHELVAGLIGKRPWGVAKEYEQYLNRSALSPPRTEPAPQPGSEVGLAFKSKNVTKYA